jgi:hypothetical protein
METQWLVRIREGHVNYHNAKPAAQLVAEIDSGDLESGSRVQEVFEAINNLKIIADPPATFEVSPLDGLPDAVIAFEPDWLGNGIRVWLIGRDSGGHDA